MGRTQFRSLSHRRLGTLLRCVRLCSRALPSLMLVRVCEEALVSLHANTAPVSTALSLSVADISLALAYTIAGSKLVSLTPPPHVRNNAVRLHCCVLLRGGGVMPRGRSPKVFMSGVN